MNSFHINGKVIYINSMTKSDGHGITVAHYPEGINDGFYEIGMVIPKDMWLSSDIRLYDAIEIKGHFITIDKNETQKKQKLLHIVDEIVSVEHE